VGVEPRGEGSALAFDLGAETLAVTTLGQWRAGGSVNLERSLKVGDELGGHMVSGHVDGIAEILSRRDFDGMAHFRFRTPKGLSKFIAVKGSVALDGVSLTVSALLEHGFAVSLIPETLKRTNLGGIGEGALLNIEVDILANGELDLEDSTLAQMDIVVASVHSHFNQPADEMTARVLRALENPHVRILGHPTGRKVLGREAYAIYIDTILKRAAELGVAVEHNASPARADLNDLHLRLAKQHGCKIVINTDAHATEELDQMRYGITQLRRAWLTPGDILNTQPTAEALLKQLRPKP